MDSQEPGIEEKLVPFVEGALAEADRREVLEALPQQPELNQEVRQLREAIVALRQQAAQGLTYRSPVEVPAEQVVDYVLQGEAMSRSARSQFQLHMLESPALADEVEMLRELEEDLQQRVEPAPAIPPMSAALKAAIRETYAAAPAEPAWKLKAAALLAWFSGWNLKVAGAAVAGVALVVVGGSVGRYAHQRLQTTSTTTVAVAGEGASAPVSASPAAVVTPAADSKAPPGMVALSADKIHPEDLPRLSRALWQKQVSHSYRDGQIFVAAADVERAWAALNLNEEKMVAARPLKTGPAPEDKADGGLIGALSPARSAATGSGRPPARDVFATRDKADEPAPPAAAAPARAAEPELRPAATAAPQVAVSLPAPPEHSRTYAESAPAGEAAARPEPQPAPAAPVASKAPVRTGRNEGTQKAQVRVAAPRVQDQARPSQMALPYQGNKEQPRIAKKVERPRPPADSVAPAPEPVRAGRTLAAAGYRDQSVAANQAPASAAPAPAPEPAQNRPESSPPPVPVTVAVEPSGSAEAGEEQGVRLRKASEARSGMRPVPKLRERDNQSSPSLAAGAAAPAEAPGADVESFEVPANAPFEVAMLPVAKKLVQETVGEASVKMERRDDGTLLVTIRPARTLASEEVDKLRKLIRQKLELKDEDVVVIRQP